MQSHIPLSSSLEYGQARANETGRNYLLHGWVDEAGDWHRKVCVDHPINRESIQALNETIFQTFTPAKKG